MPAPFRARSAGGLLAAAAVGLSTAVLAAPAAAAAEYDIDYSNAVNTQVTVPMTVCAVEWDLRAGAGGASTTARGSVGDYAYGTTPVVPGSTLLIQPGQPGGSDGAGGTAGASPSGGAGGAGAGGGGGASIVRAGATTSAPAIIVAAAGGGAGTGPQIAGSTPGSLIGYPAYGGSSMLGGGAYTAADGTVYPGGGGATDAPGAGGALPAGAASTAVAGNPGHGMVGGDAPAGAGGGGGGWFGGGSGASDGTTGAGGGGGSPLWPEDGYDMSNWGTERQGYVRGTYVPCTAPTLPEGGPVEVQVGDGRLVVAFSAVPQSSGDPYAAKATGWEISLDGGATWTAAPGTSGGIAKTFTGLTNGRAYAVVVRATSLVGPGAATEPISATPHAGATPSPTPTPAPTPAPAPTPTPAPDATSGPAAPAKVPAGSGTVTGPGGTAISTITPGREIVLSGSGYAPFSTVALYVYSTPRSLGTVTADATGSFSTTVTIPAGLEAGAHHLVAAGVDPDGAVRYLRTDVTLPAASSSSTGPELAWTGFEALPFAVGGGLALAAGAALLVAGRRRRAS